MIWVTQGTELLDQRERVIEGIKQEITLCFISAKKARKCMKKGCRIYAVEVVFEGEYSSPFSRDLLPSDLHLATPSVSRIPGCVSP